jgi:hypothetical protein
MFKQITITAIVALFAITGAANAQEPRDFSQRPAWFVHLPGTQFKIAFDTPELQVGDRRPTKPLLDAMVAWLGANFDLPAVQDQPQIRFAPVDMIAAFKSNKRRSSTSPDQSIAVPSSVSMPSKLMTWYDPASRTIYLPEGWTGETPAEVSVLVHELVHHMQNVAGLTYDCAEAREKPAYRAQAQWLELFGQNLADEFEIDAMTILVRTNCMH